MPSIAIYTRLSHDPTGYQTATARQEQACRAYARSRGWEVAAVYEDVDVSAADPGADRPQFDELVAAVGAGLYDGILVWKLDRLVRRPSQFESIWAIIEDAGAFLASVTEPVDSSSPIGLAVVRMLVTFASLETATQSVRLRAKYREQALAGVPHRRGRAYGLNDAWTRLNLVEAANIREAASRVLAGETVRSIAHDWNARGLPAPGGGQWHTSALASLLRSPRLAGQRVYRGEVVAPGEWPAVLDEVTSGRLRSALVVSARRRRPPRPGGDLLAGLLSCGRCGATLTGRTPSGGRLVRVYRCPEPPTGCGRVSISVPIADAAVESEVRRRLRRGLRLNPLPEPRMLEVLDAYLEESRELLRSYRRDGSITRVEFNRRRWELESRRDAVERQFDASFAEATGSPIFDSAHWESWPVDLRRAVVRRSVSQVRVMPARFHGNGYRFDRDRLYFYWRDDGDPVLGIADVAAALGLSRGTVRSFARAGVLAAEKVDGEWRIFRSALTDFVDGHRIDRSASRANA